MKRQPLLMMLLVILLTGCSSEDRTVERGMILRDKLLSAGTVSFLCNVTADYGETCCSFALQCEQNDDHLLFEVKEPESIAGIQGKISNQSGALTFEDTVLYFALLADGQLSPVSAPWIVINTLKSGYLRSVCGEEDGLRITLDDSFQEEALMVDVWTDEADIPICADILYKGQRVLSVRMENVLIQ